MEDNENPIEELPEIIVNEFAGTKDSTVVVEEETRTVLLTDNETIIIEKDPMIDIQPKNRPRHVYAGMWGPMEIATVGLGMLAILATVLLFVLVVLPAKKELEANRLKRNQVETELLSERSKYGNFTKTEDQVAKILTSANDFETTYLRNPLLDKTSLYQRINSLIQAYGLTNTSGPDYAPLEITDGNRRTQEAEGERGRSKFQSLFPGVYVTTIVEGSYQNLRRFIREIETSQQFVIISTIEFEPAENEEERPDPSKPAQASINQVEISPMNPNGTSQNPVMVQNVPNQQAKPRGKTRGETVSLRLEMAAYFRRPNFQPIVPETNAQQ